MQDDKDHVVYRYIRDNTASELIRNHTVLSLPDPDKTIHLTKQVYMYCFIHRGIYVVFGPQSELNDLGVVAEIIFNSETV
jgi:hypothetical protein